MLYVGKARALKKRVINYALVAKLPQPFEADGGGDCSMEFITTNSEVEALLESNMIKKLKPRFNILLKDDKSFPYILFRSEHEFPQVQKHACARGDKGEYYGPFASAGAVNRTIDLLQRIFKLRNSGTDSYFAARKRPCLQYHIKDARRHAWEKFLQEEYAENSNRRVRF